jgi:hypothetical protein
MPSILRCAAAAVALTAVSAVPCRGQEGVGLGARMSMIRTDARADLDALRFFGGQLRARVSPRTAIELSVDVRTETDDSLTLRVRDLPVQGSVLLYPVKGAFSPYVLGGAGWYFHRIEALRGPDVLDTDTTRRFGWHAGFGAEVRLARHAGLHGDYRYTFLNFGSDDDRRADSGIRLLPGYEGSMWTAGLTVYF